MWALESVRGAKRWCLQLSWIESGLARSRIPHEMNYEFTTEKKLEKSRPRCSAVYRFRGALDSHQLPIPIEGIALLGELACVHYWTG